MVRPAALRIKLPLLIFAVALICQAAAAAAQPPQRAVTALGDFKLSVSLMGEAWLFELSAGELTANSPFDFSPMVAPGQDISRPEGAGVYTGPGGTTVRVSQNPPQITVSDQKGLTAWTIEPMAPEGRLAGLAFYGPDYSHLYGLGSYYRQLSGQLNLLGQTIMPAGPFGADLVQGFESRFSQIQIPVVYGLGQDQDAGLLFIDETRPISWSFSGQPWTATLAGPLGPDQSLRFFVALGDGPAALRRGFMKITGTPPTPPAKALGVWVTGLDGQKGSDWGEVMARLKNQVPGLSGLMLTGAENLTNVLDAAKGYGLEIMSEESPYVAKDSPNFANLEGQGALVRMRDQNGPAMLTDYNGHDAGLVDHTNEVSAALFHGLTRAPLMNAGLRHFRLTGGEPEKFSALAWYKGRGAAARAHSHYAWAGRYALDWMTGVNRAVQGQRNRDRLFLLSRAGTAGVGRLGGGLYNAELSIFNYRIIPLAKAQMAMSGVDYYSFDLAASLQVRPREQFSQLYDTWVAQCALTDLPLMLPESLALTPAARYNLALRESLAPYYYHLAHEARLSGSPVIAPLYHYFPDDIEARTRTAELMIGPHLLVGAGLAAGQDKADVYVPQGRWYNLRTGEVIDQPKGGQLSLDAKFAGQAGPPLLARASSIIPTQEDVTPQNQPAYKAQVLKIFLGDGPFDITWREDDGQTQNYLRGEISQTRVEVAQSPDKGYTVTIKAVEGRWPGTSAQRRFLVDVFGLPAPGEATLDKLPYSRLAHAEELTERDSGWSSGPAGQLRFKTPMLDTDKDHVLYFR